MNGTVLFPIQVPRFSRSGWMTQKTVDYIAIRRYYFSTVNKKVSSTSLHGFGDASKGAYCAVVYLCVETEDGYTTSLEASKSRVLPLTPMTIPMQT